jgi:stearoyl-CoA desaturase (delta-9 desaturase)
MGMALPFALGAAIGGSLEAGLTGLLWGGAVRLFVLHHLTFSINSICHVFGHRRFVTADHSRNVFWLALPTFGEAWHNNHHAFPTSAHHGLRRWQVDPSAAVIRTLEACGLAWDVVRVSADRQERTGLPHHGGRLRSHLASSPPYSDSSRHVRPHRHDVRRTPGGARVRVR